MRKLSRRKTELVVDSGRGREKGREDGGKREGKMEGREEGEGINNSMN